MHTHPQNKSKILEKPRWDILSSIPWEDQINNNDWGNYDRTSGDLRPTSRREHTCWIWNNHYYIHGGESSSATADMWKFDLETMRWKYINFVDPVEVEELPDYYPGELFYERQAYPNQHPGCLERHSSFLYFDPRKDFHPYVFFFFGKPRYGEYNANIWKFDLVEENFILVDSRPTLGLSYTCVSTFTQYDSTFENPGFRTSYLLEGVKNESSGAFTVILFGGEGLGFSPNIEGYVLGDLWKINDLEQPEFFSYPIDCPTNGTEVCPYMNGRGVCVYPGICICEKLYSGENCSSRIPQCFGIMANYSDIGFGGVDEVCNGNGVCVDDDVCECNEFTYGKDCSITPTFNFTFINTANEDDDFQLETYPLNGLYDDTMGGGYPGARRKPYQAYNDHHLYIFGGSFGDEDKDEILHYGDFWKFSTQTNEWILIEGNSSSYVNCMREGDRPGCGSGGISFFINGTYHMFGGTRYGFSGDLDYKNDIFSYDEESMIWEELILNEEWDERTAEEPNWPILDHDLEIGSRIGGRTDMCYVLTENSKVVIMGGYGVKNIDGDIFNMNDVWSIDISQPERGWSLEFYDWWWYWSFSGDYSPMPEDLGSRRLHQCWLSGGDERYMYVHGGIFDDPERLSFVYSDLWKWDLLLKRWEYVELRFGEIETYEGYKEDRRVEYPNVIPGRIMGHRVVPFPEKEAVYLFFGSGEYSTILMESIWKFDLSNERFSLIELGEYFARNSDTHPSARIEFVAQRDYPNDEIYIFGGFGNGRISPMGILGDLWVLENYPNENINNETFFNAPFCNEVNDSLPVYQCFSSDGSGEPEDVESVTCMGYGVCECSKLYRPSDMSYYYVFNYDNYSCSVRKTDCFGYDDDQVDVCSSKGNCTSQDECTCLSDHMGKECELTFCHGIPSNDTENVCNGNGECLIDSQTCLCYQYYQYVENCSQFECFGVFNTERDRVCSGNGKCVLYDVCECDPDFYGVTCEVSTCFGFLSNDTGNVCRGHGVCLTNQTQNCVCQEGYFSQDCELFECFDVLFNLTDLSCSGHGECLSLDNCSCHIGYNTSENCDEWICSGINNKQPGVCSSRGDCVDLELCNCTEIGYFGDNCDQFSCYGIDEMHLDVCGGHGNCEDPNVCFCELGYYSSTLNGICDEWFCGDKFFTDSDVCSGRGECKDQHDCDCQGGYEGDQCETWSCGYDYKDQQTCSGNGKCLSPDDCDCDYGYNGEKCENNLIIGSVLGPTLSLAGIGTLLIFLCFLCCCCTIFICFCTIALISLIVLGGITLFLRLRVKKFSKLRDFDILLQEQEIEDDESIAHLRINKSLFEVPYEEIKLERILGEGGSESTVYLSKWKGTRIAFKCFKTRSLCTSQDVFNEFEREVQILSSISHPYILRFLGCSLKPPRVGILMEFCPNGDLEQFLKHQRQFVDENNGYSFKERLRMCLEIISAVDFIHSRNIIHRDLKLENILVDSKETTKLMDFGLSRIIDNVNIQKTKQIGTSFYMAPEITISSNYNEKCDVFSFAIMMFVIFTENYFPYGNNMIGIESKVAMDPSFRPSVEDLKKSVENVDDDNNNNKWLVDTIVRCWDHKPEKRPSFAKLVEIFEKSEQQRENNNNNTAVPPQLPQQQQQPNIPIPGVLKDDMIDVEIEEEEEEEKEKERGEDDERRNKKVVDFLMKLEKVLKSGPEKKKKKKEVTEMVRNFGMENYNIQFEEEEEDEEEEENDEGVKNKKEVENSLFSKNKRLEFEIEMLRKQVKVMEMQKKLMKVGMNDNNNQSEEKEESEEEENNNNEEDDFDDF